MNELFGQLAASLLRGLALFALVGLCHCFCSKSRLARYFEDRRFWWLACLLLVLPLNNFNWQKLRNFAPPTAATQARTDGWNFSLEDLRQIQLPTTPETPPFAVQSSDSSHTPFLWKKLFTPERLIDAACVVYILIASLLLGRQLAGYFRWRAQAKRLPRFTSERPQRIFAALCQANGFPPGSIELVNAHDLLPAPAAFGLFHKKIAVPDEALETLDDQALEMLFIHELAHFRAFDPVANCLFYWLTPFLWFNVFYFWAFRRLKRSMESGSDRAVILHCRQSALENQTYIRLLLRLGSRPGLAETSAPALGLSASGRLMKFRIMQIMNTTQNNLHCHKLPLLILCIIFFGGLFLLPGFAAEPPERTLWSFASPEEGSAFYGDMRKIGKGTILRKIYDAPPIQQSLKQFHFTFLPEKVLEQSQLLLIPKQSNHIPTDVLYVQTDAEWQEIQPLFQEEFTTEVTEWQDCSALRLIPKTPNAVTLLAVSLTPHIFVLLPEATFPTPEAVLAGEKLSPELEQLQKSIPADVPIYVLTSNARAQFGSLRIENPAMYYALPLDSERADICMLYRFPHDQFADAQQTIASRAAYIELPGLKETFAICEIPLENLTGFQFTVDDAALLAFESQFGIKSVPNPK